MVVIGNKADMKKDRAVSKEEGKALADEFGANFLEVSVCFWTQSFSIVYHHKGSYCCARL